MGRGCAGDVEPAIGHLVSLKALFLAGNRVKSLPMELFGIPALETLVLNNNAVAELPPEVGTMRAVRELRLSNNRIAALPLELGRLASLTRLSLAYNALTALPATIGALTALTALSIASNFISALPPIMGVMSALREVSLLDNPLEKHPPEVVGEAFERQPITKMWLGAAESHQPSALAVWLARVRSARITKDLDACKLGLAKVPQEVLAAVQMQLVHLRLKSNSLIGVPPEIARLSTLTLLDLSYNALKSVPASLGEMTNLTALYLNNNKLARLPLEIGHLPPTVMRRLAISNNRLETPPREMLTASTAHLLRYYSSSEEAIITGTLRWDWCKVMTGMRRIAGEVPNWADLVEVHLDQNEVPAIDAAMVLDMPHLEVLELRRNRITAIPAAIAAHSTLRRLAVSYNRITALPVALGRMHSLTDLEIAGMTLAAPPQRVLRYGTENTLAYLAALADAEEEGVCVLSRFDLDAFPPEVMRIEGLTALELDHMELTEIPESVTKLASSLTRLSVAHNRIAALPACVAELTNLAELLLPHNRVERLLPAHHALTSLAYLDVNHNPIRTPPMEVLSLILARKGAPHSPSSLSPDDLAARAALDSAGPASPELEPQPGAAAGAPALPGQRGGRGGVSSPVGATAGGALRSSAMTASFHSDVSAAPSAARLSSAEGASVADSGSLASLEPARARPSPERVLAFLEGLFIARRDRVLRLERFDLPPPPPPPRTNRTRRVPHPVLIGHAASLSQVRPAGVAA